MPSTWWWSNKKPEPDLYGHDFYFQRFYFYSLHFLIFFLMLWQFCMKNHLKITYPDLTLSWLVFSLGQVLELRTFSNECSLSILFDSVRLIFFYFIHFINAFLSIFSVYSFSNISFWYPRDIPILCFIHFVRVLSYRKRWKFHGKDKVKATVCSEIQFKLPLQLKLRYFEYIHILNWWCGWALLL